MKQNKSIYEAVLLCIKISFSYLTVYNNKLYIFTNCIISKLFLEINILASGYLHLVYTENFLNNINGKHFNRINIRSDKIRFLL